MNTFRRRSLRDKLRQLASVRPADRVAALDALTAEYILMYEDEIRTEIYAEIDLHPERFPDGKSVRLRMWIAGGERLRADLESMR